LDKISLSFEVRYTNATKQFRNKMKYPVSGITNTTCRTVKKKICNFSDKELPHSTKEEFFE
jgi:hypothetical protein